VTRTKEGIKKLKHKKKKKKKRTQSLTINHEKHWTHLESTSSKTLDNKKVMLLNLSIRRSQIKNFIKI
jgi:hypothetical protein